MSEKKIITPTKKKRIRPVYIIIGLLVVAGFASWQFIKYHLIHSKVNSMISEKTKGLYSINYDSLFVDEITGNLHVRNVELIPDTNVYNDMVENKTNPPVLLHILIPSLDVLRIKTPKALVDKEIDGGRIEIERPTIEVLTNQFMKDTSGYAPDKDIYRQLLGKLSSIKMDTIEVNGATLIVKDIHSEAPRFKGNKVSILMTDLLIDSAHQNDSSRILFAKNFDFNCEELSLPSNNKEYQFHFQKLAFASARNSFYIGKIAVVPRLEEKAFAEAAGLQKDRYDIDLEKISLVNIRRESLWRKKIEADSLTIQKSTIKIYRDLAYPHDSINRVGKYPQQELMQVPFPLLIKKVIVSNSFIEYKERNAKSRKAGSVQFYNVTVHISPVTNIVSELEKNDRCILDFQSKFLNQAPLQATLTMFPHNSEGKFGIKGSLGKIHTSYLNALTEPMALVKLESGTIRQMDFDFTGNDVQCQGKLKLLYDDLKVSLLKNDKTDSGYSKKVLPSFAANVVIKNENPSKGESPRVVDAQFKRIIYKSFFNVLWKTIFSGVKETVGMK